MGIRIEMFSGGFDQWDSLVAQSPQTTVFHQSEALEVLAHHFDASIYKLVGYVGEEPVGILPFFMLSRGPFQVVTSPPLGVEINIGPALLNVEQLKQRKTEQRNQSLIDGCMDWISEELNPDYIKIGTTDRYTDIRPFLRRDFNVTPTYTYVLDITDDEDDIMMRFSRDARSNIRNTDDDAYEITEGGLEEIDSIVSMVTRRYAEQDTTHYLDSALVGDLYERLEKGQVRPYVCRVDGEIVSGIIVLDFADTVYRWQGGAGRNVGIPANDLLDWHIIRAAHRRERQRYDLVGAMLPRLCEYKSKFDPTPTPLFTIERSTVSAKIASLTRKHLPETLRERLGI